MCSVEKHEAFTVQWKKSWWKWRKKVKVWIIRTFQRLIIHDEGCTFRETLLLLHSVTWAVIPAEEGQSSTLSSPAWWCTRVLALCMWVLVRRVTRQCSGEETSIQKGDRQQGNHHLQRIGSSLQCSFHPFRLPWWCISGTSNPCGRGLVLFNSGGFSVVFTILLCAHVDLWAPVKLNDDIDHLMLEEKVPLTVKNNRFDGIVSFSTQTPRLFVRHWTGLISERTTEFSASQQDANICNKQQFRTWLGKVTVENTTIWFFWMRICVGQKTATPTFSLGLLWATEVQQS